jgi:2'-5' RNA ligase
MSDVELRPANRLFVAADLPAAARAWLAGVGAELAGRAGGRAVPEGSLHVTLDFLGRVPAEAGPALAEAVTDALSGPPIRVAPGGLRARPRAARARLVAVERDVPERAGTGVRRQPRGAL